MAFTVNPAFKTDLKKYGLDGWNECFHCGNCTAICPLTEQGFLFPRKSIRNLQMGLEKKIESNVDPWLCYYCGECSETCPRDANPGELMMSLRRYLTSVYDWTGISRLFYRSKWWELGFISFLALLVIGLFAVFSPPSQVDTSLTAQGGVKINQFAPVRWIEMGDWIMAAIIGGLLISNIFNMYTKIIGSDKNLQVPFKVYMREFYNLVLHFVTQMRFSKCDNKSYWLGHFLLMSGYTIMFIFVVALLPWFQTEEIHPITHPQRWLGYYATFGILIFLGSVLIGRIRKKEEKLKFSHFTDWLFIYMLLITTVTGILIHIFRINGMPYATYYTYVIHLAVLVPMLMVEVPFSKWSHLAYRPFAIYFSKLKKSAKTRDIVSKYYHAA